MLATVPITPAPMSSNEFYGSIPDTTFTLNQPQAGAQIIRNTPYYNGDYILEFIYSGDSNFAAWPALDAADFAALSTGTGTLDPASVYALVNFGGTSTETKTAFIQSPENTAAGDTSHPGYGRRPGFLGKNCYRQHFKSHRCTFPW